MPRGLACRVLRGVEEGRGSARDLLDAGLADRPYDPRDRDLAREIAYGALRRRVTLDHVVDRLSTRRLPTLDPAARAALRVGAYQILFLDRVPVHAAVNAAVEEARRGEGDRGAGFVNAVLRSLARAVLSRGEGEGNENPRRTVPTGDGRHTLLAKNLLPDPAVDEAGSLSARWSMPRWIVKRWLEHLGAAGALQALRASAARPATWLRPMPGKEEALRAALTGSLVAFEEDPASAPSLLLRGAGAVEELPGFREGLFLVQDPAASRAVTLLAPRPGDSILELGCGRGGKTAFLAAAVGPSGRVVAVDRDAAKLALLHENLARVLPGTTSVEILEGDALAEGVLPPGPFDRVLVDSPCSNTGVLARRVEARHRVKPQDLEALAGLGRRLFEAALDRLRPGGTALYSVCSLEREEGPDTVRRAIRKRPDCAIVTEESLLPVPSLRDGGYCAVIAKGSDPP